jgi:Mrp family chromosome partitioning ATPase
MVITKIPNLYVIPSGKEPSNPGLLLSSPRMEEFRRLGGKLAAYMVIDTPPLGIVSDAVVIQKYFAHYIFVVRSGKTNVMELVNRINEFDRLPEKILGYVLNRASHNAVGTYRRYSKYYAR